MHITTRCLTFLRNLPSWPLYPQLIERMIQRMILRVPVGENIFFSFRKNKLLCHTFYDKIEVFFGAHAQALWLCGCADIGRRGCLALFFGCGCMHGFAVDVDVTGYEAPKNTLVLS